MLNLPYRSGPRKTLHRLNLETLSPRLMLSATPSGLEMLANADIDVVGERTTYRNLEIATIDAGRSQAGRELAATTFLNDYHSELNLPARVGDQLEAFQVKHGLASSHIRYQQMAFGLPVHGAEVTIHTNGDGAVTTVHNAFRNGVKFEGETTAGVPLTEAIAAAETHAGIESTFADPDHELVWLVQKDGTAALVWEVTVFGNNPTGDFHTLIDAQSGKVISQENHADFATGTGDVFEPNPYQTQGSGSGLSDNNDANSAALAAQMVTVTLEGLDEGTGLLKGEYVDLATLNSTSLPDVDANEPSRVYQYTRDDPRFEQVTVYHSVDQIQRYFQSLGFSNTNGNGIRDFPTLANAHWYSADQSFYSTGDDAIHFGDGGVDDGEDADIVAHEYGHAVQHDQNASWGGGEMGAMGEGFGDYLAASFYADLGNAGFQASHAAAVGEWDATSYSSANPPNLRRVDGNKMYPFDLTGGVHSDGEIWSAALWDIRAAIGATTIDQLVLESHFALPGGALMPDGANAILQADVNINGGANQADIEFWFEERGILGDIPPDDHGNDFANATHVATPSATNALIETAADVDYFSFDTVAGEAYELEVQLGSLADSTLTLYDTNGTSQLEFDDDDGVGLGSLINWTAPSTGTYFLKVDNFSTQAGSYTLDIDSFTPPVDDHGNFAGAATASAANTTNSGEIDPGTDVDWFSFAVPAGANLTLTTALGTLSDTVLWLYDTDGTTELEFDDDDGPGRASLITYTTATAGTYYAVVGSFGTNTGTYTLDIMSDAVPVSGDFNNDGSYNCLDIDPLIANIAAGTNTMTYDLTGDNVVDIADRDAWLAEAGAANLASGNAYLLGDADLDGTVGVSDFGAWNSNKFTDTAAWCSGDFNASGRVDGRDFLIWNANKFNSADNVVSATPEDTTEKLAVSRMSVAAVRPSSELARVERAAPLGRYVVATSGADRAAEEEESVREAATDSLFAIDWQ